jgi:hypothetical protein
MYFILMQKIYFYNKKNMKLNTILLVLLFAQITYIYAFEDFALIRTQRNMKSQEIKASKSFLQKKLIPSVVLNDSTISSKNSTFNQNTTLPQDSNTTSVNITNNTPLHNNYTLCDEINRVMIDLIELDNGILELRKSFNNHSKNFLKHPKIKESKKLFQEKESKEVMTYINKINEITSKIEIFKGKLLKLSKNKNCVLTSPQSVKFELQSTQKDLQSLLQIVSEEVKEFKLPVNFIAIASK